MYLKSLTLRGFKSFADRTGFDFEPGITVVVGPNGSGKSNVVDALTWVLGTGSAKSLRGASMADVVFAGSRGNGSGGGRAAMGRAAVEITIDNSDQALPIEFSEVTVGRATFAGGETSYSINGVECRLLDVEELLSDTGLGRLSHTIVGQGRLDAILQARPEDRRAFVEEAAGILKHRRRKERALRKLAQMEGHAERLDDLVRELRRQLRPLERQAEAAARHAEVAETLHGVRRRRAARQLAALDARWTSDAGRRDAADRRLASLEQDADRLRAHVDRLDNELAELAPRLRTAAAAHVSVAGIAERLQGLVERVAERRSALMEAVEEPVAGRDPTELRSRGEQEQAAVEASAAAQSRAQAQLEHRIGCRRQAEQAWRDHEDAVADRARRRAAARERRLRWEAEVSALRSALTQASGEERRLASQLDGLRGRASALTAEVRAARDAAEAAAAEVPAARCRLDDAGRSLDACRGAAEDAVRGERELERRRATLDARIEALREAAREPGEALATVLRAGDQGRLNGLLGPVAECVAVAPGAERAVAAALGPLGEALAVADHDAAEQAAGVLRGTDTGRAVLLVAHDGTVGADEPALRSAGAEPLAQALEGDARVVAALRLALHGVWRVADFDTAVRLVRRWPQHTFVTPEGDLIGRGQLAAGAGGASSPVLARAAADAAITDLRRAERDLEQTRAAVTESDRAVAAAQDERDDAAAALREAEARRAASADRLARVERERSDCAREVDGAAGRAAELQRETGDRTRRLQRLEDDGPPGPEEEQPEPPDGVAHGLHERLAAARDAEVDARLALGAAEQRTAEHRRRVAALEQEAQDVERRLADRERRRRERLVALERCAGLADVAASAVRRAQASLAAAARERDALDEARSMRERELGGLRERLRDGESALVDLAETRHAEELRRAELRLNLDAARARAAELGLDPDALPEDDDDRSDEELAEHEDTLARQLGLMGAVNHLAREELASVQERHAFLTKELEDLRASRRDLLQIVSTVDERIRDVFSAAFADVAGAFERVFPRLFPGGEGRLLLTDPDDLLDTGIEIEARPPGKRVKRLSLLSGGERSLTALAVLFAIFAARPSPFYVLDEVEAALDDVNLQRFLDVVVELGRTSQLVIVTHQRRTMEVAGTLYGVSMRSDGVSRVVSQRIAGDRSVAVPAPALSARSG